MMFPDRRTLRIPPSWPLTLLVVVDTEEEFDWNAPFDPGSVQVRNIAEQPVVQAIFDAHGVAPTYVVDYPVAATPAARDVLRAIAAEGRCTIGAHLHPWVTPPHEGPVGGRHSYAGNLPPALERAKLAALTDMIETGFGQRPTIYKAGRYGVGPDTMASLAALGYRIDCSVVPFTDFSPDDGPDFSALDNQPFTLPQGLTELPLSVNYAGALAASGPRLFPLLETPTGRRLHLGGIASRAGLLERLRLSPEGHTLPEMIRQTRAAMAQGQRLFMMTYHSSSLLPGAAPYVRDAAGLQAFLATISGYCEHFFSVLGGRPGTLAGTAAALADT
ncbi:MAG: polysaccharide deacetylase family protein [Janthinobacterium lividum]